MDFSSLSAPNCAECEVSLATLLCDDEDLLFCESCSMGLHSKKARSHHILKPLRVCDQCEKAVAVISCAPCGGRCEPLTYCSPCSSHLHSRKARAHHTLDRIQLTKLSFPSQDAAQTNEGLMNHGGKSPLAESSAQKSATQMQLPLPKKHTDNPSISPNFSAQKRPFNEEKIHGLNPSAKLCNRPAPHETREDKENHGPMANRNPRVSAAQEHISTSDDGSSNSSEHGTSEDKENHGPMANRNPRVRAAQEHTSTSDDGSSSSSEHDTSEDDETYGTKKYRKGSVTLEAFVVDAHDHEDGETKRGSNSDLADDEPKGGVHTKICKMLELGLHSDTPDIEAQQALKNAQRLLTKYNLQQADVLKGGLQSNKHAFKGGMRMVELRSTDKNKSGGRFEHWVYSLARIVSKYFDTQYFVQKQSVLKVVFYGIRQNVNCAGYAFAASFNRISKLSSDYIPLKQLNNGKASNLKAGSSQNLNSRVSRMSYRNGLVEGLFETVKAAKAHKKRETKPEGGKGRKELEKKGAISEKGERDEPNLEADSSDDESGFGDASDDCMDDDSSSSCDSLSEEAGYESSEPSAALNALVVHSKKIGDDFLKEKKIKITTRKQDSPIIWDGEAFSKGKRDSKSIDLGQKAITAKARKTSAG